jgi:hypothetical protein
LELNLLSICFLPGFSDEGGITERQFGHWLRGKRDMMKLTSGFQLFTHSEWVTVNQWAIQLVSVTTIQQSWQRGETTLDEKCRSCWGNRKTSFLQNQIQNFVK